MPSRPRDPQAARASCRADRRRQPTLGKRARTAGVGGLRGRRRHAQGARGGRDRAGCAGAERLLVLDRELVASGRGDPRTDLRCSRRVSSTRRPSSCSRRSHALHRQTRRSLGRAGRAHGLGRVADAAQPPHHPVHRVQLRRARGDPRRRQALPGRHGGGLPPLPLRARPARPRRDHPHRRRAAPVELPALAGGLLRARVPR